MTMFNKASKPQSRIDSLIGATTRIEGNVVFSGACAWMGWSAAMWQRCPISLRRW